MDVVLKIMQYIMNDLGAVVGLPIIIIIMGLIFRMKIGAAVKSGITVGIGFKGLSVIVSLLMTTITPVVEYYGKMGTGYSVTDLPFPVVGGASWTVPFAAIVVPAIVLINIILLKLKVTKVINVDIWNFMHFLVPGALAYVLFHNVVLGAIVTIAAGTLELFFAQWLAPKWQETFECEGVTCTTLPAACGYFVSVGVNKLIDLIPGLRDVDVDMESLSDKLGIFGDSSIVGLIIGFCLGMASKQGVGPSVVIGMEIATVLIVIPKMVGIMMEGITPIGNAATAVMRKSMGEDAELLIGMDVAVGLGHPAAVTCTILAMPFVILMGLLIPGMKYFPIGVLGTICYCAPSPVAASKGNMFRSLICTIVVCAYTVVLANVFIPEATAMLQATGVGIKGMVTEAGFGGNFINVIVEFLSRIF
ncbi:MAG: PTS galactitol transporter subunit IIC [Anaerostipes sp.]|nr:PTS galactitol transporter subunit IIC [Anaerostipes sp.]